MKFFQKKITKQQNESSWIDWKIYIKHFQVNETKIFSRKITKQQNEFSWIEWKIYIKHFQINETKIFFFENDDCISFSFDISWINENDREFALMKKFFFWKRWLNFIFIWRIVSLRKWQSIIDFFVLKINQIIVIKNQNFINKSIVDFLVRRNQSIFSQ